MRLVALLSLVVFGAGCAGSAPPLTPLPVPVVERLELPTAPEPVAVEVEVVQRPVVPPPTPERRIARRSVYEEAGLTEWVLENGLTVVYAQRPVDGYHARLGAPTGWAGLPEADRSAFAHIGVGRWGAISGRLGPGSREASGQSDALAELVEGLRAVLTESPDAVQPFDAVSQASPRWGIVQPEARADGGARRLAEAFAQPEVMTVVLVGAIGAEWVEPMIADRLSVRGGGGARFDTAEPSVRDDGLARAASGGVVAEYAVSAGWEDRPTARVLDAVLAARSESDAQTGVTFDAGRGEIRLRIALADLDGPEPDLRAPITSAESDAARRRAVDHAASAEGAAQAVSDLYDLPGRYRPARRPEGAAALSAAIARTPSERVDDLLRRLLASPDTAGLGLLPNPPDTP